MAARFSIRHRLRSFRFAFQGLRILVKTQHNTWIHLLVTLCVVSAAALLQASSGDWCLLIIAIALVWITEAFNTALEFLADVASPDFHPTIGYSKDVAAAAVLLATLAAVSIGLLIFVPLLMGRLSSVTP